LLKNVRQNAAKEWQGVQLLQVHKEINLRVGRAENHIVGRKAAELLLPVPGHRG
jgi:hypothetical protein